jgi:hypothetical protein
MPTPRSILKKKSPIDIPTYSVQLRASLNRSLYLIYLWYFSRHRAIYAGLCVYPYVLLRIPQRLQLANKGRLAATTYIPASRGTAASRYVYRGIAVSLYDEFRSLISRFVSLACTLAVHISAFSSGTYLRAVTSFMLLLLPVVRRLPIFLPYYWVAAYVS